MTQSQNGAEKSFNEQRRPPAVAEDIEITMTCIEITLVNINTTPTRRITCLRILVVGSLFEAFVLPEATNIFVLT